MIHPKEKGNSYERKCAKILSEWLFNDNTVLFRDSTSGGRKIAYKGDIVPVKQINEFDWKTFPFIIETKYGYKNQFPTFANQNQLRTWLTKLDQETDKKQYIPIFIWKVSNNDIFITKYNIFRIAWELCLNHEKQFWYVYNFKELLDYDFFDVLSFDLIKIIKIGDS